MEIKKLKILWEFLNFEKYKNLLQLRKLGKKFAISNLITCTFFFIWYSKTVVSPIFSTFFFIFVIIHITIGMIFLNFSSIYTNAKWYWWGWLTMIFISPLGIIFLFYCCFSNYWMIEDKKTSTMTHTSEEQVHNLKNILFDNSAKKLEKKWEIALSAIKEIDNDFYNKAIKSALKITNENFEDLNIFQISTVIAIFLTIKQFKQKSFKNFLWNPHWYENRNFTFAIKNEKPISQKNKYPFSMAVIVLDELNNYQKNLNAKNEVKNNLCFSPAKIICIQKGFEYKIYVNQ